MSEQTDQPVTHDGLLAHLLEEGQAYDRRKFLSGGVALAGGLTGLLALSRSATAGPSAAQGARGTVIYSDLLSKLPRGGRLEVIVAGSTTATLNWYLVDVAATAWDSYPAHDFLEYYDEHGNLVPSLAQSVEQLDARHLRYTLHANARFHNGRPVTAHDVKATFEWVQNPQNKATKIALIKGVQVKVLNDRQLVLVLPTPNAGFRAGLPQIPIIPVETAAKQASHPIGCGPFLFKQWVRGAYVDYVRNPNYWNPQAPRLDSLRLSEFADSSSGAQAFLAGKGDLITYVPTPELKAYASAAKSGKFVEAYDYPFISFILFNAASPNLKDPRVRQAVGKAVDRSAIVATALGGIGRPAYIMGGFPGNPFYDPSIHYPRDLAGAKNLLAQAGLAGGFDGGDLIFFPQDPIPQIATVVQANLADIGIKLNLKTLDVAAVVDATNRSAYQFYVTGWLSQYDPTTVLDQIFATSGGSKLGCNYSNPAADKLLNQARTTSVLARRKALYHQANQILFVNDPAAIPTVEVGQAYAYRKTTNGTQYAPGNPSTLYWRYPIASTRTH